MPCNPNDIHINVPSGPSGIKIPGFGLAVSLNIPNINLIPAGFPEDLLDLFNKLQFLLPSGILKPNLSLNFTRDILDSIMNFLDQFMPFLMLYKFFLPILNLILCIIEVLCALANPFKLISAINRLFRDCLPAFLRLFPFLAIIIMLISLILLLIKFILYLIDQIVKFVKNLLRNIMCLYRALTKGDSNSILAIAKKIGAMLCIFQNLFVLLAIFNIIFQAIKDILSLAFSIPPCDSSDPSNANGCCTPDVCPEIVKSNYTRVTGKFQYINKFGIDGSSVSPLFKFYNFDLRSEGWQLFDVNQTIQQQFINIVNAYDVTESPKPVFFPVDGTYNATTTPKQAPYTIDLRLFYNPISWGRALGVQRWIRFHNCIVTHAPTTNYTLANNTIQTANSGVLLLAGGSGYEDDGKTKLYGYDIDGITPISTQATLENFIHKPTTLSTLKPVYDVTDGYEFFNVEYTFKPNIPILFSKNLITLGCEPSIALNKLFVNSTVAGDYALKLGLLNGLLNASDGNPNSNFPGVSFPDVNAAQECLSTAVSALRTNLTPEGIAEFTSTTNICLLKLQNDANSTLNSLIGLGVDPCKSTFKLSQNKQFTNNQIIVYVNLNESNSVSLVNGIPVDIGANLASRIKAYPTLGNVDSFVYDGYNIFTANLVSDKSGTGSIMLSFDNNMFCNNIIPTDITIPPTHTLQELTYQFIYAPRGPSISGSGTPSISGSAEDETTQPRRDSGDASRDNN